MAQYQTLYNCILMFVYLRAPWTNVWNIFAVQYVCESFGWIKQKPQALKLSIFFLCLAFRICNGTLNSFQSISTIGLNVVDFQFICVECTKSTFDKIHFPLPLEVHNHFNPKQKRGRLVFIYAKMTNFQSESESAIRKQVNTMNHRIYF